MLQVNGKTHAIQCYYLIPQCRGQKNTIRTSIHRIWLDSLVQTDPEVAYFRSIECSLNDEQKSLLQDLAMVCGFKATSDLPVWLKLNEREKPRAFLNDRSEINQLSRYVFKLDSHIADFSSAIPLPGRPKGLDPINGLITGWLGNQTWVLKILDGMQKHALKKIFKDM